MVSSKQFQVRGGIALETQTSQTKYLTFNVALAPMAELQIS